jgi:hypothetical protein
MTSRSKLVVLPAAAALTALGAAGASAAHGPAEAVRPGNFTAKVTNAWFPLKPGTTFVYAGVKDGLPTRDVFAVTHRTRRIDGVQCIVIDDRVYSAGRLSERTRDYYTQDRRGNVWYFGEDTAELDRHGKVTSTEGTWHAGVHGARPGIFMPAHPRLGEHHRQEYYKGHAEDQFRVVSLNARIKVPYGTFRHALRTREWTKLEPGVIDSKHYVRGVGEVSEASVRGARERSALVRIERR